MKLVCLLFSFCGPPHIYCIHNGLYYAAEATVDVWGTDWIEVYQQGKGKIMYFISCPREVQP